MSIMRSSPRFRLTGARATIFGFVAVLAVMLGITSYSVTLYRLFCQVTGAGGTIQRVARGSTTQTDRVVTVFFDTSMAFFEAVNHSNQDIVGHATFNVTPEKVGLYFKKIQCFCFNEERLHPGEHAKMPVTFFVDPQMAQDPDTADVHEITLSYTFFQSKRPEDAVNLSRFAKK